MIFSLIGIAILIYALKNYKRAFLIFIIFKMFYDGNVSFMLPGISSFISLDFLMLLSFTAIFFVCRKNLKLDRTGFPYKAPFILITISWLVSAVFSLAGFHFTQFLYSVIDKCILVWILWCVIDDIDDIKFILKGFTIAFLISAIYAFFEKLTMLNPIHDYKISLARGEAIEFCYNSDNGIETGRGYRVRSIFSHPIGAGINWGLYIIMALIMILKYNLRKNKLSLVTALLCVPCIFFANSRSCLLFLFIGCLSFVDFKNKRFRILFIISLLIIAFGARYISEYSNLVNSLFNLFDSNLQEEMGGSSIEMRQLQLTAVLGIWAQSPIWGLGDGFTQIMQGHLVKEALGFESIWFVVLTNYGLLGTISYVVLMYYSLVKLPKMYKSRSLFFISLAYWVTMTATTAPALMEYFYYLIIFIIIKLQMLQLNNK